jgi:hypothetical protein
MCFRDRSGEVSVEDIRGGPAGIVPGRMGGEEDRGWHYIRMKGVFLGRRVGGVGCIHTCRGGDLWRVMYGV